MARRSTVQRDPRIAGDPELSAYPDFPDDPDLGRAPARGRGASRGRWSGGGGRWLVWTGRAVLWALIVVIVVNGVRAPFERFTQQNAPSGAAPASDSGFPTAQGSAFATQFAEVYLNFDGARLEERRSRLAPYLPEGTEPQFGWDGFGRMSAGAVQPYGIEVVDADNAVVTVLYQSDNRRQLLSVPVYHDRSTKRFVVAGRPGILPAPKAAALPPKAAPERDRAAEQELRTPMEDFFKAYAASDTASLQRYADAGITLEGFGGAFTFLQLKELAVPLGGGATREVTATVLWGVPSKARQSTDPEPADPGQMEGKLEQAYLLTVVKQGDKWFVKDIRGAYRSVAR
ncbi:conjugal transfer protein [Streptosporangium amethystogenes subsp. fukuiense]|uniref:Conjugal transfer protein n=1 Tax=Streptosporangium amethystogenes subsp. fukuiense TaxID=698418 RepID=A0ABW2TB75_9ACTN